LPILLFVGMDVGVRKNYWGLVHPPERPIYAGFMDPNCARDSFNGPPCTYISPSARKTVLLIGDSHAGHISQALIDAATYTKWNSVIWAHSGCHVQFADPKGYIPNSRRSSCLKSNMEMLNWVKEHKPDLVAVSQSLAGSSQTDLTEALVVLRKLVPKVLLVGQSPVFPDSQFMNSGTILSAIYLPPKSFPVSRMVQAVRKESLVYKKWALDHKFQFLDPFPLFCNVNSCNRWSSRGWLYRDQDHLSPLGADRMVPDLERILSANG
jgi:hypothetical protein